MKLFYSGGKTLSKACKGKEVPSQPDFVLHVGKNEPSWTDVELLFKHAESSKAVSVKFLQWLRNAWSVFYHQPFRRYLYGIMFIKPCAYICYADHGGAMYSEPLCFVNNGKHTQFLIDFLSGFIANPEHRGRDPTVEKKVYIQHVGKRWFKLPQGLLWYRPSLVGRHIGVALVKPEEGEFPDRRVVRKSTRKEKTPPKSSPPPEAEVLSILLNSKLRGLPVVYDPDYAIVRDDSNLEVETSSFPKNFEVAIPASTGRYLELLDTDCDSGNTSMYGVASRGVFNRFFVPQLQSRRQTLNEPLEVYRRLSHIVMPYCEPLKCAMRGKGPKQLMRIIRDTMIVYYEAYKHGFIHGGKRFLNNLYTEC
jgi:Fungal protein kinase